MCASIPGFDDVRPAQDLFDAITLDRRVPIGCRNICRIYLDWLDQRASFRLSIGPAIVGRFVAPIPAIVIVPE
jgi:hypothetical protein